MGDLVEVADVKQEAKKRFRRFALPREVDSESVPKVLVFTCQNKTVDRLDSLPPSLRRWEAAPG